MASKTSRDSRKGEPEMSKRGEHDDHTLRAVESGGKEGSLPPAVKRGDEVDVEDQRAIIYAVLFDGDRDPGPDGYRVGVVFLDNARGMANLAKWSEPERCWQFVKGEIAQEARPALHGLVQKLRFTLVK